MNPEGALATPIPGGIPASPPTKRVVPSAAWLVAAIIGLGAQAIFYQRLAFDPNAGGQFGLANAALGAVGLLALPLVAVHLAFRLFIGQKLVPDIRLRALRDAHVTVLESAAWAWGGVCVALVILPLPVPSLPTFSLKLFELMTVFLLMGSVVALAVCEQEHHVRCWTILLVAASATRLALGAGLTTLGRQAEAVLAAGVVAGFITLSPALRPRGWELVARLRALSVFLDADFRHFAAATLSTVLGIYLFTSADRIVCLQWFNVYLVNTAAPNVELRHSLDAYQITGLLVRALLWGTQPLLWVLYRERASLTRTTARSIRHFWFYLAALLAGLFALGALSQPGSPLGDMTGGNGPTFAGVAFLLGVLQGIGIFCLASRRYIECHLLAASSVVYALVLGWFGHRPDILLPDMFGLALISLMVQLLVGVVRWGRRQP